jgi:hypothetical protein
MNNKFFNDSVNAVDKKIYKLGGIAALAIAVLMLGDILFLIFYPQPETIAGWFNLFQSNALVGLLDFWGLEIPMYLMFIPVFFALYSLLRATNQGMIGISLICALLGIAIFLATNNPFSMLTLSNQYAASTTATEKTELLAAGHAVLALTNQRAVGGFNIGLFLVSIAGLIASIVMLKSSVIPKSIATIGILAFALSLADYLRQALTQSLVISLLVILMGALLLLIWFVLVGMRLYRLGNLKEDKLTANQ